MTWGSSTEQQGVTGEGAKGAGAAFKGLGFEP